MASTKDWEDRHNLSKTTIRLDRTLHEKLKNYSKNNNQTLQETIRIIAEKAMDNYEKNGKI